MIEIKGLKTKWFNKIKARYYSYLIKLSFTFKLSILKNFLVKNLKYKDKKNILWYLDYKRSPAEINFFLKKKYNLLLVDVLFIKELILFLEADHNNKRKNYTFELLNDIGVKLIVSPAIHYKVNLLGYIGNKYKIKFLVYHRECYNFSNLHLNGFKNYLKQNRNKFKLIDILIVHNQIYKNYFTKYGGIIKNKIYIIGPLRFDNIKNIKINKSHRRNKIIFFAFTPLYAATFNGYSSLTKKKLSQFGEIKYYLDNKYSYRKNFEKNIYFYNHLIQSILIFVGNAYKFPEISFEIKIKWNDPRWNTIINKIIRSSYNNYPKNLKIYSDQNYWERINKSFLVCGYGSTALLEASCFNVPSAQIICGELSDKKIFKTRGRLNHQKNCFFIVKNEKDLTNLILKRNSLLKSKKIILAKQNFHKHIANTKEIKLENKLKKLINKTIT